MSNSAFWDSYKEVDYLLKKAFIQMPGGQGGDPAAGGDPSAAGGMPPGVDPAAMGGMPPGMDPAAAGGMPPGVDPAAAGAPNPAMQDSAPGSPMITISLDQLFEIIQKVLGLAKKVGVNGAGIQQQAQPESAGGITQDQLKSTIYEALGSMAG